MGCSQDNRSIVTNFNIDGIDAVVAIDISIPPNFLETAENLNSVVTNVGTGNLIGPNHVLTAGHVIFGEPGAKVRLGENVAALSSRTRTPISSENFNASGSNFSYPAPGYNGNNQGGIGGKDLGLITLDQPIGKPSQYIGLAAFVDPQDAKDLQVTTAGFPGGVEDINLSTNNDGSLNLEDSISKNTPFLITD